MQQRLKRGKAGAAEGGEGQEEGVEDCPGEGAERRCEEQGQWAEWRCLQILGGRGKGPQKRSAKVGELSNPERKDWEEYLA